MSAFIARGRWRKLRALEGLEGLQQSLEPACLSGNSCILLRTVRRIAWQDMPCTFRNPCGSGSDAHSVTPCLFDTGSSLAGRATSGTVMGRHPQDLWATCCSRYSLAAMGAMATWRSLVFTWRVDEVMMVTRLSSLSRLRVVSTDRDSCRRTETLIGW